MQYFHTIVFLRAVAASAVAWYHFVFYNPDYLQPGFLKTYGLYGQLGVEVFFIISGFVIPWALHSAGYQLKNIGRFLVKRIIRLDPAYLVVILMFLLLDYLSTLAPMFAGKPYAFDAPRTFLHLFYLNAFFSYPWLNPVFWTLAVEFQYYLFMSLFFFALSSVNRFVRWGGMIFFLSLFFVAKHMHFVFKWSTWHNPLIFYYAPLFLLGMLCFLIKAEKIKLGELIFWALPCVLWCYVYDPIMPVLALISVLLILFTNLKIPGLNLWA